MRYRILLINGGKEIGIYTKNGCKIKILQTRNTGLCPIIALIELRDGQNIMSAFSKDGRHCDFYISGYEDQRGFDLINIQGDIL